MVNPPPVRYAVARAGETWPEATLGGLETTPGGDLTLQLVPCLTPPSVEPPGQLSPSGLALDCACGLYLSDTAENRIVRFGLDCGTELMLPGPEVTTGTGVVEAPTGMCWGPHGWLFVANGDPPHEIRTQPPRFRGGPGNGGVLVLTTPDLSVRDAWAGFQQPTYLACHRDWVLVVDTGTMSLTRRDWRGVPDAAFDAAVLATAPKAPGPVAVAPDGTIYIADANAGGVVALTWAGTATGVPIAPGTQPIALAISGSTLYLADAKSGDVILFSIPNGSRLGIVGGFQGPVTALAVGDGSVFIKPGLDASYLGAPLASCYGPAGTLEMGPVDAGKQSVWARAEVRATVPDLTAVELAWYTDSTPTPATITWQPAPCLDLLIPGDRYLWLQVTVTSRNAQASPTLLQVGAQTTGDSYLDYLPYVYSHDPDNSAFSKLVLEQADPAQFEPGDLDYLRLLYSRTPPEGNHVGRLVDLARSQLGDLEHAVDDLPRAFDPATAPVNVLEWLPSWLAFDLPPRLLDGSHPDEVRRLVLGLAALYRHRGTPRGLADFVEIYAQVRPHILEAFRERPLWVVGETPLGFGTGMPDREVEGMLVGEAIVGETGPEDPAMIGSALFASTAHRFSVIVPPAPGGEQTRSLIMGVVEAERPAHTAFHICFASPRMRVGVQARVGVDALVASGPDEITLPANGSPGSLDMSDPAPGAVLGVDTVLAGPAGAGPGTVGSQGQIGIDTRLS